MNSDFAQAVAEPGARDASVFVNCPFDDAFSELRDGIVLSIVCCGLLPRIAMDLGEVSKPRMLRILDAIAQSKYSIHDLSRCQGEGELNLARFNMPLELGVAMAHRHDESVADHQWMAMVPTDHQYSPFASDLAGYDLRNHDGNAESVVRTTASWLWNLEDAVPAKKPDEILELLPVFTAARQSLDIDFADNPPWGMVYAAATAVISNR